MDGEEVVAAVAAHREFDGLVLLVTGGGSGIGAAVARDYAAHGGRVVVVDKEESRAIDVARGLPGDAGLGLGADVADEGDVGSAVRSAVDRYGRLDSVVNCAGHADLGRIDDLSYGRWKRMMDVHAGGTFLVCKHSLPHLRRTQGSIVNVSSISAFAAQAENCAYGAAKGAVTAFSKQLAGDVAADGVRVNVVAPGRTDTALTRPVYRERGGGDVAKGAALTAESVMQRRIARPSEVAAVITFLLSGAASFVTAATYVVDGGELAQ
ncbi:SDR family NAD(P)-dependent oxidoreductase [Pseudonocardia ailaonensis]|uniref:SDR family NAD(P)-dependent oxidoreductase n=1 Tax=Pseudonocardia ailaonensis TaxID=367279 RepID=UPI0031CF59CF